ncbi:MAG: formylglycine-generating enzyme family protein, partial [Isosphaeraceae bacterium]
DVSPAERQAILMIWAEIQHANLSSSVRGKLLKLAQSLFAEDPDPGVHSAAELLLRRLGRAERVDQMKQELRRRPAGNDRRWFVGPEGHTFIIVPGPLVFLMGSPASQDGPPRPEERLHYRKIDRTIAVATMEVSIAQYRQFRPKAAPDKHYTHDLQCPANGLKWYDAARYCNWLSKQDGIPREQWCYPEPIEPGMVLPNDSVERTGFRLPTEAEWEYVCRAGTTTSRFFGSSEDLFPHYGWTWLNSHDRAMPTGRLLPNSLGMFDMLGNLWEWCHDGPHKGELLPPYPEGTTETHPAGDHVKGGVITRDTYRILRGGAFDYSPAQARAAYRYAVTSGYGEPTFGLRVVRTLPATTGH